MHPEFPKSGSLSFFDHFTPQIPVPVYRHEDDLFHLTAKADCPDSCDHRVAPFYHKLVAPYAQTVWWSVSGQVEKILLRCRHDSPVLGPCADLADTAMVDRPHRSSEIRKDVLMVGGQAATLDHRLYNPNLPRLQSTVQTRFSPAYAPLTFFTKLSRRTYPRTP